MLSKFENDGKLNPGFRTGPFQLPLAKIWGYPKEPQAPRFVLVSSAGVTRPDRYLTQQNNRGRYCVLRWHCDICSKTCYGFCAMSPVLRRGMHACNYVVYSCDCVTQAYDCEMHACNCLMHACDCLLHACDYVTHACDCATHACDCVMQTRHRLESRAPGSQDE